MKTLVKNGMIVSPEDTYEADVLIEDGVIECIGKNLEAKFGDADKVIDAKGKYVLPGGIDVHTHMDIDVGIARAVDDFYTGTVAAACGGTNNRRPYGIRTGRMPITSSTGCISWTGRR